MKLKKYLSIFVATFNYWRRDNVSHLAAALSYFTIFSLAPILVICVAMTGLVFDETLVSARVIDQISQMMGHDSAVEVQLLMDNIRKPSTNILASVLGGAILLWGIIGLFTELQNSFNQIWKVTTKAHCNWMALLKERLFSFTVILGIGFLLLVSLLFSTFLQAAMEHLHHLLPFASHAWVVMDFAISTIAITSLFSLMFKVMPDVILKWHDVWPGALVAAVLFSIGKFLLGIYLAHSNIATTYGAAASLIIILVWVYYSAQILLFGAEFTKAYAHTIGSHVKIKKIAERESYKSAT